MVHKKEIIYLVLLIAVIGFLYSKIINGFFVQDEWYSFGWYLLRKDLKLFELVKFFFAPNVGHYNPLTNLVTSLLFFRWGINYAKFAAVGILMHIVVSVAFYFLAKAIFRGKSILAFFAALIFGIFASPYQGVAWVVVNIATLFSSLLGIISAILFFGFLNKKKYIFLIWSLIIVLISLLFKEITVGLLPLFFVLCLVRAPRAMKRKSVLIVVLFALGYIFFRASMFLAPNQTGGSPMAQMPSLGIVFYNFMTLPLKSLAQVIIPPEFIKMVSLYLAQIFPEALSGIYGSPAFESFAVEKIMETISLAVGLALIFVSVRIIKKSKDKNIKSVLIFGLVWTIANSLVFSLSPGVLRTITAVDSRNLYFTSIGVAILLIGLIKSWAGERVKILSALLLVIFVLNVYWLHSNLSGFIGAGIVRRNILEKIARSYPKLPPKVVFYTVSDSPYYGLPEGEKILPFQSGFGQTLLIFYSQAEAFPQNFYPGDFLWDIKFQGYREYGGRGVGYFRDINKLKEILEIYKLPPNSVISFSWNSKVGELTDISDRIRKELYGTYQ